MSKDWLLDKIIICPYCHVHLKKNMDRYLICSVCNKTYIKDKYYDFIIEHQKKIDNLDTWEKNYIENSELDIGNSPAWEQGFKYLSRFLKPEKDKTSLEVGCGIAWGSLYLAKAGVKAFCLDFSSNALLSTIEIFKRNKQNGYFIRGDINKMPFSDNTFDYIFAGGTFEHFRNPEIALRETYRVLNKKGVIFTTVPVISLSMLTYGQLQGNIPNLPGIRPVLDFIQFKILKGKITKNGFELSFTINQLKQLFRLVGFKNIRIDYFDVDLEIRYLNNIYIKKAFNWLASKRLFWPMVYIYGEK